MLGGICCGDESGGRGSVWMRGGLSVADCRSAIKTRLTRANRRQSYAGRKYHAEPNSQTRVSDVCVCVCACRARVHTRHRPTCRCVASQCAQRQSVWCWYNMYLWPCHVTECVYVLSSCGRVSVYLPVVCMSVSPAVRRVLPNSV